MYKTKAYANIDWKEGNWVWSLENKSWRYDSCEHLMQREGIGLIEFHS